MEYMSALQNDFDDFKPSLFGNSILFPFHQSIRQV